MPKRIKAFHIITVQVSALFYICARKLAIPLFIYIWRETSVVLYVGSGQGSPTLSPPTVRVIVREYVTLNQKTSLRLKPNYHSHFGGCELQKPIRSLDVRFDLKGVGIRTQTAPSTGECCHYTTSFVQPPVIAGS